MRASAPAETRDKQKSALAQQKKGGERHSNPHPEGDTG